MCNTDFILDYISNDGYLLEKIHSLKETILHYDLNDYRKLFNLQIELVFLKGHQNSQFFNNRIS